MNHNNTTDVIDEDAAVLQFPKGSYRQVHEDGNLTKKCHTCCIDLKEPYIRCAECTNINICSPCFARGAERSPHDNFHAYIVVQNEFPLFEPNWSALDEENLLQAVLTCGYGNWQDISQCLTTHSAEECESHYINTYIENRPSTELPPFKESLLSYYQKPIYAFRTSNVDDPPRHESGSYQHLASAGYNAARSDFDVEHDDDAERVLVDLNPESCPQDDPDYELLSALNVAIVDGYNDRLAERRRRHEVIRNHGLLSIQKTVSWLNSFESTITREMAEKLTFLMQVLSGFEIDMLYEGLHARSHVHKLIAALHDFRANGLTSIDASFLYLNLSASREEYQKTKKNVSVFHTMEVYKKYQNIALTPGSSRKSAGPLDIYGLPGYDRLSPQEQELCRTVRIVPASYLEFRQLLEAESKKHGYLKLAQARSLIKIDVNKTRKLYDFLAAEGYINQFIGRKQTAASKKSTLAKPSIIEEPNEVSMEVESIALDVISPSVEETFSALEGDPPTLESTLTDIV